MTQKVRKRHFRHIFRAILQEKAHLSLGGRTFSCVSEDPEKALRSPLGCGVLVAFTSVDAAEGGAAREVTPRNSLETMTRKVWAMSGASVSAGRWVLGGTTRPTFCPRGAQVSPPQDMRFVKATTCTAPLERMTTWPS